MSNLRRRAADLYSLLTDHERKQVFRAVEFLIKERALKRRVKRRAA